MLVFSTSKSMTSSIHPVIANRLATCIGRRPPDWSSSTTLTASILINVGRPAMTALPWTRRDRSVPICTATSRATTILIHLCECIADLANPLSHRYNVSLLKEIVFCSSFRINQNTRSLQIEFKAKQRRLFVILI